MTTPVVRTLTVSETGMSTVTNIEAVRQQAIHRIRTVLGEWFLDVLEGVPHELIFTRRLSVGQVSSIITEEVRKVRHVVGVTVTKAEVIAESRRFTYQATIETDFSESTVVEVTT